MTRLKNRQRAQTDISPEKTHGGWGAPDKVLDITRHQGDANQRLKETAAHTRTTIPIQHAHTHTREPRG